MKTTILNNVIFECKGKNPKGNTEHLNIYLKVSDYYIETITDDFLHGKLNPLDDNNIVIKTLRGIALLRKLVLTEINEMHVIKELTNFVNLKIKS